MLRRMDARAVVLGWMRVGWSWGPSQGSSGPLRATAVSSDPFQQNAAVHQPHQPSAKASAGAAFKRGRRQAGRGGRAGPTAQQGQRAGVASTTGGLHWPASAHSTQGQPQAAAQLPEAPPLTRAPAALLPPALPDWCAQSCAAPHTRSRPSRRARRSPRGRCGGGAPRRWASSMRSTPTAWGSTGWRRPRWRCPPRPTPRCAPCTRGRGSGSTAGWTCARPPSSTCGARSGRRGAPSASTPPTSRTARALTEARGQSAAA